MNVRIVGYEDMQITVDRGFEEVKFVVVGEISSQESGP